MKRSLWWVSVASLAALGCKQKPVIEPDDGAQAVRREVLAATAECVTSRAADFAAAAAKLEEAAGALSPTTATGGVPAARKAFADAMVSWQMLEVMRFGPAAPNATAGGRDLRDRIYSWPLVSTCAVDDLWASGGYQAGLDSALVNRKGLAALEHLLFSEATASSCLPGSEGANAWAALPIEEREARRRAYAVAAATNVRALADQLVDAWAPAGGNFGETLRTAGSGNAVYPTTQSALNAVTDGLFAIEREGKDLKLAVPLGLRACESGLCPEQVESRLSRLSKRNLAANFTGFRQLVQGCGETFTGTGFDDLLAAVGQEALAQQVVLASDGVDAALRAIEEPDLERALNEDAPSVRALYDALKALNNLMKIQFVTVLDLELPSSIEGDVD